MRVHSVLLLSASLQPSWCKFFLMSTKERKARRILSLSASPSVLSFWMFSVSSFVFVLVPLVQDFLLLALSLAFSCGGIGETAPGFSPSRQPAAVSLRGAHRPCFQRSGLFLRAPLPKGGGSFSFSPGHALPLAFGMWHLTCPPFRVRLRLSIRWRTRCLR